MSLNNDELVTSINFNVNSNEHTNIWKDFDKDTANAMRIPLHIVKTYTCNTCGLLKYRYCVGHYSTIENYTQQYS